MFGNVKAYEGCALFRESIANHPKFRAWYERMKATVLLGYKEAKYEQPRSTFFFLESVSDDDGEALLAESYLLTKQENIKPTVKSNTKSGKVENKLKTDSLENITANTLSNESNNAKNLSELFIFRILTLNYLAHLIVFTYAAYMK